MTKPSHKMKNPQELIVFTFLLFTVQCYSQTLSVSPSVFTQSATIKFTVASPDTATLTVYNRWGDLVETIFSDTFLPAANYNFTLHGDSFNTGVYIVHLILANRSYNTNAVKESPNGISDIRHANLNIYPSPTSNNLYINYPMVDATFTIIDMTGRNLSVPIDGNKIDVSTLPSGSYFLYMLNKNVTLVRKFVKK
jgi:hypothetical protein